MADFLSPNNPKQPDCLEDSDNPKNLENQKTPEASEESASTDISELTKAPAEDEDSFMGFRYEEDEDQPNSEDASVSSGLIANNDDNPSKVLKAKKTKKLRAFHQGQLDFFCAAYAVINALVLTHGIGLGLARGMLAETMSVVSTYPWLWRATLYNETDFFWLVDYMLYTHCSHGNMRLRVLRQSGSGFKIEEADPIKRDLNQALLYKNTHEEFEQDAFDMSRIWELLKSWLPQASEQDILGLGSIEKAPEMFCADEKDVPDFLDYPQASHSYKQRRAVLLRFHRYLPFGGPPIVSHWTTACAFRGNELLLFDATADPKATHSLFYEDCVLFAQDICREKQVHLELDSIYLLEGVGPTQSRG